MAIMLDEKMYALVHEGQIVESYEDVAIKKSIYEVQQFISVWYNGPDWEKFRKECEIVPIIIKRT